MAEDTTNVVRGGFIDPRLLPKVFERMQAGVCEISRGPGELIKILTVEGQKNWPEGFLEQPYLPPMLNAAALQALNHLQVDIENPEVAKTRGVLYTDKSLDVRLLPKVWEEYAKEQPCHPPLTDAEAFKEALTMLLESQYASALAYMQQNPIPSPDFLRIASVMKEIIYYNMPEANRELPIEDFLEELTQQTKIAQEAWKAAHPAGPGEEEPLAPVNIQELSRLAEDFGRLPYMDKKDATTLLTHLLGQMHQLQEGLETLTPYVPADEDAGYDAEDMQHSFISMRSGFGELTRFLEKMGALIDVHPPHVQIKTGEGAHYERMEGINDNRPDVTRS